MKTEGWLCSLCKSTPPLLSPFTTTQHHHPAPHPHPIPVLSSNSTPQPPPSHSCLQIPPMFVLRVQAQIPWPPQTPGTCLISHFYYLTSLSPPLLALLAPLSSSSPLRPPLFYSSQAQWHIQTPQVCSDTQPCRTGTQRLTVVQMNLLSSTRSLRKQKHMSSAYCSHESSRLQIKIILTDWILSDLIYNT